MKDPRLAELTNYIVKNGHSNTHARKEMLKLFLKSDLHLKAEEICLLLKDKRVSVPTVYRNLDLFNKLGIIKAIVIDGERRFELKRFNKKQLHIHFTCQKCGKIKEYYDVDFVNTIIRNRDQIENQSGDNITEIDIVMSGLCKRCQ